MSRPSDDPRHLQRLATLVMQRRVALGYSSKEAAAAACRIAPMTYRKVEGTEGVPPQRVRDSTYAKINERFGFVSGACQAVANGETDTIKLIDGGELAEGAQIRPFDPAALEDGLLAGIVRGASATDAKLTPSQVGEMQRQVVAELRKRGVIPDHE